MCLFQDLGSSYTALAALVPHTFTRPLRVKQIKTLSPSVVLSVSLCVYDANIMIYYDGRQKICQTTYPQNATLPRGKGL
jgi:hypothetical protein